MTLSVVLPCFNEEEAIAHTVNDVVSWLNEEKIEGEVIVVNDGSTDGTAQQLQALSKKYPQLKVMHHPVNKGYGSAIITGCDAAQSEIIGFMDSDGQFRAKDIQLLLPHLKTFKAVIGRRKSRSDNVVRKVNARLYKYLIFVVLGIYVHDVNCGMKLFHQSIWKIIRPRYATGGLFNGEIFVRLQNEGIPWLQVAVPHYPRQVGKATGANPMVILKMFRELLSLKWHLLIRHRVSSSQKPHNTLE